VDEYTLKLLIDKIDSAKSELKSDINSLKENTFVHIELNRARLVVLEADSEEGKKHRWKFSGAILVLTLALNIFLAWVTRDHGQ
jgi:hypothetical protein